MGHRIPFLTCSAIACIGLLSTSAAGQDWQTYMALGQKARTAQQSAEAEKQFKAAIEEAKKAPGRELELAESLDGLAALYRDQNKYSKSEEIYKQSLDIKGKVLGPWHLSVAQTLDDLAGLLSSQRKYDRAEPLYKRAREIREQALAAHPDVYVDGVSKPVLPPK